ncbi:hypothetical protein [Terriglobus roseus]|uniref:hypothetical protein n=1 Tax=Terriglobus roseus TaxID=392734 RepID=UPI000942D215|nr:hypothetical protein [Terriglobus roseus]
MNIHLDFGNTGYGMYPDMTTSLLKKSGIRYYRTGITAWNQAAVNSIFKNLGTAGIRGLYVIKSSDLTPQLPGLLTATGNVAGIEYQNEPDNDNNPSWISQTRTFGPQLFTSMHNLMPSVPVIGPALVYDTSASALGVVPMDNNNLHSYMYNYPPDIDYPPASTPSMNAGAGPCTRNAASEWVCFPGLKYAMATASVDAPGKPFWITETGYTTSGDSSSVPVQYQAAYFTRQVLWAVQNGVSKVFFYELLDESVSGTYGIVTAAMQPKPGFTALSSVINLMADKNANFSPSSLNYLVSGGDRFIQHGLYEKSDGTFYLVLWQSAAMWDGSKDITPAAESVSVSVPGKQISASYTMQASGEFKVSTMTGSSANLSIGVYPVFLKIN